MNDSVLVEIRLPCANATYEVRLPLGLNVHVASLLAARALSNMPETHYALQSTCFLAWQETGEMLDSRKTVAECKVINGSRLLLI